MAVTRATKITQAAMDALATLANTKIPSISPDITFTGGNWLDEICRLRMAIAPLITDDQAFAVSDKRVFTHLPDGNTMNIAQPGITTGYRTPAKDMTFFFEDAAVTGVATRAVSKDSGLLFPNQDHTHQTDMISTFTGKIRFGGDTDGRLTLNQSLFTNIQFAYWLFPDRTSGHGAATISYSTDIPGVTFVETPAAGVNPTLLEAYFSGSQVISPGEYTFTVSCDSDHYIPLGLITRMVFDVIASTIQSAPEVVHNTIACKKIDAIDIPADGAYPFGIYLNGIDGSNNITAMHLISIFRWEGLPDYTALGVYTTRQGIWAGKTAWMEEILPGYDNNPYQPGMAIAAPDPATDIIATVEPSISNFWPPLPVFRDTDTLPTGGLWDSWTPFSMQILQVVARRLPVANASGIKVAPEAPADIEVEIGYTRSGTFISIEALTIPAGAVESNTIYPLWPMWTATPLQYRCDEAVFVAAVNGLVNTSIYGLNSTINGFPSVFKPIFAAHYNDTEALLNLL